MTVGADDSFREFVQTRLPKLSRVAFLLTGNHHSAEDLLQTAMERLAQRWKHVSATSFPDAYARKILYNEHVSVWRKRRYEIITDDVPDQPVGHDDDNSAIRRLMVQRALSKLTPKQRAVLVLRFFEGMSTEETAEVLNCSSGTVKSQTKYALGRLRSLAPELVSLVREAELV